MIPRPTVLYNETPPAGWIAFHKKALWLEVIFPLYPFIRKYLRRFELVQEILCLMDGGIYSISL